MSRSHRLSFMFVGITVLSLCQTVEAQRGRRAQQQSVDTSDYQPRTVLRAFEPIVKPPSVSAQQAKDRLRSNDLVLGVEIDGVSRAYPINMLTGPTREIFNDVLGKHAIAATW